MKGTKRRLLYYRLAFTLLSLLLLGILVLLPLTMTNIVSDLLAPPHGQRFHLWDVPDRTGLPSRTTLDLSVVALEEVRQRVTLEVAGYDICPPTCDWSTRIHFYSILDTSEEEGLPPAVSIILSPSHDRVTHEIQLPIEGQPIRYPFDAYDLWLGVALEQVFPDGTVRAVPPAEASHQLFLTIEERLPQLTMTPPDPIDPQQVQSQATPVEYVHVAALTFRRQVHLRVLAMVLVLLVAAVACTVFLRPFQDLLVNIGALVIGIWGMRSILTPTDLRYVTAVDLALSVVILSLLLAITIRALLIVRKRSQLQRLRRSRRAARSEAPAVRSKRAPVMTGPARRYRVPHRVEAAATNSRD